MGQPFKVDMFWNQFTNQVATRVLRDCLSIQRLARVNRADFVVGCDTEMHKILTNMGIQATADFVDPNMVRVYLVHDDMTDELQSRLPECADTELITLTPMHQDNDVPAANEMDPYAGVQLFRDWKEIPETLPLDKAPPKGDSDPMYSPWL